MKELVKEIYDGTPRIVGLADNERNTKATIRNWKLGPSVPSEKPGANKAYWADMADIWGIDEAEARRQMCANCEYYNNTPEMMKAMDRIPFNQFDEGAGGRGYCHRFEFICHNLRSCIAWERKDYEMEED